MRAEAVKGNTELARGIGGVLEMSRKALEVRLNDLLTDTDPD